MSENPTTDSNKRYLRSGSRELRAPQSKPVDYEALNRQLVEENRRLKTENKQLQDKAIAPRNYQLSKLEKDVRDYKQQLAAKEKAITSLKKQMKNQDNNKKLTQMEMEQRKDKDFIALRKELDRVTSIKVQLQRENERLKKQAHVQKEQKRRHLSLEEQLQMRGRILKRQQQKLRNEIEKQMEASKRQEQEIKRLQVQQQSKVQKTQKDLLDKKEEYEVALKRTEKEKGQKDAELRRLRRQLDDLLVREQRLEKTNRAFKNSKAPVVPNVRDSRMNRNEKAKVLVMHHVRVKEFWNTIEKLRGRRQALEKHGDKYTRYIEEIKILERKLRDMQKNLKVGDKPNSNYSDASGGRGGGVESNRGGSGGGAGGGKEDDDEVDYEDNIESQDMNELLDVLEKGETLQNEMDTLANDLHSKANEWEEMKWNYEVQIEEQNNTIEELQDEIEQLKQSLDDSKSVIDDTASTAPDEEDNEKRNRADTDNEFQLQFLVLRKKLDHSEKNEEEALDELRGLIRGVAQKMDEPDLKLPMLLNDFDRLYMQKVLVPSIDQLEQDVSTFIDQVNEKGSGIEEDDVYKQMRSQLEKLKGLINDHLNAVNTEQSKAHDQEKLFKELQNNLGMCRSLLEHLGSQNLEEEKKQVAEMEGKLEEALENLGEARGELRADEKRAKQLREELKDVYLTLVEKALEGKDKQMSAQGQFVVRQMPDLKPNLLTLTSLKDEIAKLLEKCQMEQNFLKEKRDIWESLADESVSMGQSIEDIGQYLYKFKRRPQRKVLQRLKGWNKKLDELYEIVKKNREELDKAKESMDQRWHEESKLNAELSVQEKLVEYWLQYHEDDKIAMKKDSGDKKSQNGEGQKASTESKGEVEGDVDVIQTLLQECRNVISDCKEAIRWNLEESQTQYLVAFNCGKDIGDIKDTMLDLFEKKLPIVKNLRDISAEDLERLRASKQVEYNNDKVKKLAGMTSYDDSIDIWNSLQQVQSWLGIVSPLHYHVVANYLQDTTDELHKQLKDLKSSFEQLKSDKKKKNLKTELPSSTSTTEKEDELMMCKETRKYDIQLVVDLCADYGYNTRLQVIDEDIEIISGKVAQLQFLEQQLQIAYELQHLKNMYWSFRYPDVPQPVPIRELRQETVYTRESDGTVQRLSIASTDDYQTGEAQKYAGLSCDSDPKELDNAIQNIEMELQRLRAQIFPIGFNFIYQSGMLWDDFIVGTLISNPNQGEDQEKDQTNEISKKKTQSSMSTFVPVQMHECYKDIPQEDRREFILDLMDLEWQYMVLLAEREDDPTQISLNQSVAEYYRRLFRDPCNDPTLEKERENLWSAAMTGHMRREFSRAIANDPESFAYMKSYLKKQGDLSLEMDTEKMAVEVNVENSPIHSNVDVRQHIHHKGASEMSADEDNSKNNFEDQYRIQNREQDSKQNQNLEYQNQDQDQEREQDQNQKHAPRQHQRRTQNQDQYEDGDEYEEHNQGHVQEEFESQKIIKNRIQDPIPEEEEEEDMRIEEYMEVRRVLENREMNKEDMGLPALIETICEERDRWEDQYRYVGQEAERLQKELEKMREEVEEEHNRNEVLSEELEEAYKHIEVMGNQITELQNAAGGEGPGELEYVDVLKQLHANLQDLREETEEADTEINIIPTRQKVKGELRTMRAPLDDLANDLNSEELRIAHEKLGRGIDNIKMQEDQHLQDKGPLLDVLDQLLEDVDEILHKQPAAKNAKSQIQTPQAQETTRGDDMQMDMKYPETKGGTTRGEDYSMLKKPNQIIKFDNEFPYVERIRIGGGFFNKHPICEMKYNSEKFDRESKYFKWLWRMLLLEASEDQPVPDFPLDLPESHWPEGYLKRRRKELNLFLMQCHSIGWIRDSEIYSIFLTIDPKSFDKKRKDFDKHIIKTYKK